MTIDEAIVTINQIRNAGREVLLIGSQDALQLGIEALKHIQSFRSNKHYSPFHTLPRETEEGK